MDWFIHSHTIRHSLLINDADFLKYTEVIFPEIVEGEDSTISNGNPTPLLVIPHFEGLSKTKEVVRFKYFSDAPIQNGGLKRVWISTQNPPSSPFRGNYF